MLAICLAVSIVVAAAHRATTAPTTTTATQALARLKIIERSTEDPTYRRVAFGRSWADLDADGCNTRDEVLVATVDRSLPYKTQRHGRCRADMVAGTWTDLYTGTVMTWTNLKDPAQAQGLQIDHIVSLAEAFRHGARAWTQQRRIDFANDELNLTPTLASVNRAKSDKDPASWSPPAPGHCAYATRYISVKVRWDLPVDRQEKTALQRLLRSCPNP